MRSLKKFDSSNVNYTWSEKNLIYIITIRSYHCILFKNFLVIYWSSSLDEPISPKLTFLGFMFTFLSSFVLVYYVIYLIFVIKFKVYHVRCLSSELSLELTSVIILSSQLPNSFLNGSSNYLLTRKVSESNHMYSSYRDLNKPPSPKNLTQVLTYM